MDLGSSLGRAVSADPRCCDAADIQVLEPIQIFIRTPTGSLLRGNQDAVIVEGSAIPHPQETRINLTLSEKVAVQFRFEFNVVDDRR